MLGQLQVASVQRGGRLPEHGDELVEDRVHRPLDHPPGIAGEESADRQRNAAAHERVEETVRREALGRGLQRDRQQRRDASLGYQESPPTEQHRRRHRQCDHDPDLDRPGPDGEYDQIRNREPAGHPEDELGHPTPLLADRDAQRDHRRYGGEERLLVPEYHRRQSPRYARGYRRLQDGPSPRPEALERSPEPPAERRHPPVNPDPRQDTRARSAAPPRRCTPRTTPSETQPSIPLRSTSMCYTHIYQVSTSFWRIKGLNEPFNFLLSGCYRAKRPGGQALSDILCDPGQTSVQFAHDRVSLRAGAL